MSEQTYDIYSSAGSVDFKYIISIFNSFGVNDSKLITFFAPMASLFYIWSHWRENSEKFGAIDTKIVES